MSSLDEFCLIFFDFSSLFLDFATDLRKFITKIGLFLLFFLGVFLVPTILSSYIVSRQEFLPWQTESNTLIIKEDDHFDLMFMGISHARNFSRFGNQEKLESIFNKSIINIAQGGNRCGIREQQFYLSYFLAKGNSVDEIIYMISPPMLYSITMPIASNTFRYEKIDWDFVRLYWQFESENKNQRLISLFLSKMEERWFLHKPKEISEQIAYIPKIDSLAVQKGFKIAYSGNTLNQKRFEISCKELEETIVLAQQNNIKVSLMIPPAVFGQWPGHANTMAFASEMNQKYGLSFYDFSLSVLAPKYYYDHHHLNTPGVIWFSKNVLSTVWD